MRIRHGFCAARLGALPGTLASALATALTPALRHAVWTRRPAARLIALPSARLTALPTARLTALPTTLRHAVLAAACAAGLAASAHAAEPLPLADALAAARANLDVSIAARSAAAAQADVLAADHAPLPTLSGKLSEIDLQHGIGPGSALGSKRIDKSVGIDWTWERGGKRALRTDAARRGAAAALADVDEVRTQQLLAAHGAFFDLLAAQGRVEQLAAVEASAVQTFDIARKRLSAGDVAVQDAARASIEAERARAESDGARLDVQRAQLTLAQLIGSADAAGLQARADWPDAVSTIAPSDMLIDSLIEQRADVRATIERVRAAESALAGAQAQRKADVTWGVSLDHYPGTSTRQLELRAAMPLTWGYRYDGENDRAQALLEQARDALAKARRAAAAELQLLRAQLAAAAQRAGRFDAEIVPRSRQVADRAELAYGRGALPLTDLLDARRTLRSVLVDALGARAELAKAIGAWQLRSGGTP